MFIKIFYFYLGLFVMFSSSQCQTEKKRLTKLNVDKTENHYPQLLLDPSINFDKTEINLKNVLEKVVDNTKTCEMFLNTEFIDFKKKSSNSIDDEKFDKFVNATIGINQWFIKVFVGNMINEELILLDDDGNRVDPEMAINKFFNDIHEYIAQDFTDTSVIESESQNIFTEIYKKKSVIIKIF